MMTVGALNLILSRRAEEGLQSRQGNYVDVSMTRIALKIQNAKVYQVIHTLQNKRARWFRAPPLPVHLRTDNVT